MPGSVQGRRPADRGGREVGGGVRGCVHSGAIRQCPQAPASPDGLPANEQMKRPPSVHLGVPLLAILALASGVFLVARGGQDAAPAGPARAAPADPLRETMTPLAKAPGATEREPVDGEAQNEAPAGAPASAADELRLHFDACTFAPTDVTLTFLGNEEPATAVGPRTWSLPWLAVQRAGAKVEVEFGANVRLSIDEIRERELDIAMPPLVELTAVLRDARAGWTVEWTPETPDGQRLAAVTTPFAVAGASGSLQLTSGGERADSGSESLPTLAPLGSSWTVFAAAPGLRVEDPGRNHVVAPATLTFEARPQFGVLVLGSLPAETLLLVYADTDMRSPLLQARVESPDAVATTIAPRGAPLAANAAHHLECLLPDGRRASAAFVTDVVGAAQVSAVGLRLDPPTRVSLGGEHEPRHLYLRMGGPWQAVPSDAGDFHREEGALSLPSATAGELLIVHSRVAWDEGFLVTTTGAVARLRPTTSRPVVPDWLPGQPAQLDTASLSAPDSTVAWRLSFLATDGDGEESWLSIATGRGSVAELTTAAFWATPFLRTKLWIKVLQGEARGERREVESPFR